MIDLHSHILPAIDDGSKDLEMSLEMAKQTVEAGVTKMVCTPHIHQGYFDNNKETIRAPLKLLARGIEARDIPLKLAFAAEVRICPEITTWVSNESIPFIGKWENKNALLLELPHSHVPPGTDNLIRWLLNNSIQPIVAHPERNRDIIADYSKLKMLRQAGAIFQVTAGAFCSRFGDAVSDVAHRLLMENMIAFVASDMHNIDRRPNDMGFCREKLSTLVGQKATVELTYDTPNEITQDLKWL